MPNKYYKPMLLISNTGQKHEIYHTTNRAQNLSTISLSYNIKHLLTQSIFSMG